MRVRSQIILALLMSVISVSPASALAKGEFCDRDGYITEYICGSMPVGSGWYQGQDGCWYRNTGRPCGQQPPPPPYSRAFRCESWQGRYNECGVGPNVWRVTLQRQISHAPCVAYQTFGATFDRIWVDRGCSGDFLVEYRY